VLFRSNVLLLFKPYTIYSDEKQHFHSSDLSLTFNFIKKNYNGHVDVAQCVNLLQVSKTVQGKKFKIFSFKKSFKLVIKPQNQSHSKAMNIAGSLT
jgi:hypothetical protein